MAIIERDLFDAPAAVEEYYTGDPRIMSVAPIGQPNLAQTVRREPQVSYDDYMQWLNRNNLPAVRASGAHFSPAGAREGYEDFNLPPVMYQRSPYATAAYRTFVDPWGQMMVQPLVGFPSRYPHVLSGVPTNFTNRIGWAMSLLGPLPQFNPQMPAAAPAQRASHVRSSNSRPAGAQSTASTTQPAAPVGQHWVHPESDPNTNVGNYILVPDDSSLGDPIRARGQARVNANYALQGATTLPQLQPQVQPVAQAASVPPWYAPIFDDLASMGIRFPNMDYQPR